MSKQPATRTERSAEASRLHRQGVLQAQAAKYGEAAELIGKALELVPDSAVMHRNLGMSLQALGRLDEAVACYNRAIDLKPDYVQAHDSLGNLFMDQERFDQAVACYSREIDLEPDRADGHYNLANALLRLGRAEEAVVTYQRALQLEPEFVEAYNNLGAALARLGRYEAAASCYDRAASLQQPGFEKPLANKAMLLMETGRIAQSLPVIDAALAVNPDSGGAWHVRSGLKTFERGDPDIQTMEALLARLCAAPTATSPKPALEERICLEFALGKAWMDAGDAPRAFAHLDQGNRLMRSTYSYDSAAMDRWIAAMAAAFTPGLLKRLAGAGHSSDAPVFVVGMPRSGTTLVEQILSSHPDVHGAGELTLVAEMVERISGRLHELCPPGDPQRLSALLPEDAARLGREIAAEVCALAPARRRIVDKAPLNFLYVGFIHAILPDARIIHCRRDAVDTCLSCYTKLFRDVKFASDLRELGLYYRGYERLMDHWRNLLPPERFIEVRYEDVVAGLESQARRLVAFCGLPWHAACLDFHKNSRPVRTASLTQVRQPIYGSSVGRWRAYARYLGPLLDALGLQDTSSVI